MQISEHFTLEELTKSDTAKKLGISNSPSEIHKRTLTHTCNYCLEPLRKLLKGVYGEVSIVVTSGYRGPALNKAVGGVSTSQHCTGEAVDCKFYKKTNGVTSLLGYEDVFALIKRWVAQKKFSVDQCIVEYSGNSVWVHISYKAGGATVNRNQFLRYKNGKYTTA